MTSNQSLRKNFTTIQALQMLVRGSNFVHIPEPNAQNCARPLSTRSNKKIMFEFQRHKSSKAAWKDMQLQESLKVLDKYFQDKKKCFSNLLEQSYKSLIKDNYKQMNLRMEHSSPTIKLLIKGELKGINPITALGRANQNPQNAEEDERDVRKLLSKWTSMNRRKATSQQKFHKINYSNQTVGDQRIQKHLNAVNSLFEPCRVARMELQSRKEPNRPKTPVVVQTPRPSTISNVRRFYHKRRNNNKKEVMGGWEGQATEELDIFTHRS